MSRVRDWKSVRVWECESERVWEWESVIVREWLFSIDMKTKVVQHVKSEWKSEMREWDESVRVWEWLLSIEMKTKVVQHVKSEWMTASFAKILVPNFCLTFRPFFPTFGHQNLLILILGPKIGQKGLMSPPPPTLFLNFVHPCLSLFLFPRPIGTDSRYRLDFTRSPVWGLA